MLKIEGLCVGYSDKNVLKDVSFSIPAGKVTVLLGPNGCGKSTLLKALCGIVPISSGEILLNQEKILKLPLQLRAQKIAYLSQNRQVPDITVERMVLHGRFPYLSYPRRYRSADLEAAHKAMEQMELEALKNVPLKQLSGGQRQKVYIAAALAQDTEVMLLDEPTTFLDVSHQLQMITQAKSLAAEGRHVLMVIHDLGHALSIADQIVLLQEGRVVSSGSTEDAFESGKLDDVFGIRMQRIMTDKGWHYYYEGD